MVRSVMLIFVTAVALVVVVTPSIGDSVSNEYHEFFLAFPSSGDNDQLYIDITTYEEDPVEFLITNKTGDVLFNLTVDPGEFTNVTVPLQYKVTFPFDTESKGLLLSTINDTKVVVYGTVWDPISGSGDSFLALPCVSVPLLKYVYYAVTSNRSNPYVLLVGSQDNTVVEITPSVNVSVYQRNGSNTITTFLSERTLMVGRLETILLLGNTSLTGLRVETNQPISFYSGNMFTNYSIVWTEVLSGDPPTDEDLCGGSPTDAGGSPTESTDIMDSTNSTNSMDSTNCTDSTNITNSANSMDGTNSTDCMESTDSTNSTNSANGTDSTNSSTDGSGSTVFKRYLDSDFWSHFSIEQLPQVASWGIRHLTAPIAETTTFLVLSSDDCNHVTVGCNAQHKTRSFIHLKYAIDSGGFVKNSTTEKEFCVIASTKPVIVVLFDEEQGSAVVVPPTHNYKSHYAVSVSAFLPMLREWSSGSGAINVAVLINSTQFQPGKLRFSRPVDFTDWVNILCSNDGFAICGYGYVTELLDGETYSVTHTDGVLAAIAYYSSSAANEASSIALPVGNAFLTGPQQVFNPNVVALNDETIRISWKPPPTYTTEILIYYTLEINYPSRPDNPVLPPINMPVEIMLQVVTSLSPGVPYNVTLSATNMAARGENWSTIVFTRELTPLAPKIVSANRVSGTTIFVSWALLSLSQARGFVENYIVTVEQQPFGGLVTTVVAAYKSNVTIFDLAVSKSYRVSVRASTIAGHGEASSMVVSVTDNAMFQLHFSGLKSCTTWMLANACEAVKNTTATLVQNINHECDSCNISENYIADAGFHCFEKKSDDVTFSASLYGISNDRPLVTLIDALESWVAGNVTVAITPGLSLSVRADCPLVITSRGELCHDTEYECVGDCTNVIAGAVGGCALVIAVVVTANVLYCCRRHCEAHGCPSCLKLKFKFETSRPFRPILSTASNSESRQDEESPKPKKKPKVNRKTKTEEYSSL